MKEKIIKLNNMSIEEIKQDHYYHCSFEFQDTIIQMWISNVENKVCFYEKSTEDIIIFNEREVDIISRILNTAGNCFFQRKLLKEKKTKEGD